MNFNNITLHAYETISLSTAGYVLGIALVLGHLLALFAPQKCQDFLTKAPRNEPLGQITLAIAMCWFFLLIAPASDNWLSALRVDLPGFEGLRPLLQVAIPITFFLLIFHVKEFLFPRALGVLGLLVVSPFLTASFLKEPTTRLLIPIWCYAVIIISLFWVGKPYLMRDQIAWILKKNLRWTALACGGVCYGLAILICDYLFW